MDELVLNERSRRKAVAGTAFLLGLGGLLTVPGILQALKGNAEAWLSLFPFAMAGLLLFMGCVGLAGRGMPDGLVLTVQGLRISLGRESFLLPASSLRAFVLTQMKPFRKGVPLKNLRRFNVQVDPAAMAGLPRYIACLRSLAEWDDRTHPA